MSILSSVAPILIFTFPFDTDSLNPVFNALDGLPIIGKTVAAASTAIGVPIPIYLDEQLTGLYVESENKNVDMAIESNDNLASLAPLMTQKSISNTVSINLVGKKDSIFLASLLALVDLAYPLLAKAKYRISYLNGTTVVLGGLIQGITSSDEDDNELVRISLVIHKYDSLGQTKPVQPSVNSIPGGTLLGGSPPNISGVV